MKSPFTTTRLPLRVRLLSSTALAVAGAVWMASAGPANAIPAGSCATTTPGGVTTIICSGTTDDPIYAGDDHTVVTLNADAVVTYDYDPTVYMAGDDVSLTLNEDSTIYGYGSEYAVYSVGDRNTITLNDGARIIHLNTLYGDSDYSAVGMFSDVSGAITLNGGSEINLSGGTDNVDYDNNEFSGIYTHGRNIAVTLNGASSVNVTGIGSAGSNIYTGIRSVGDATTSATSPSVVLNGGSSVNVLGSYDTDGNDLYGIVAYGDNPDNFAPTVTLNGGSSINVHGRSGTSSNKYFGIAGAGYAPSVTLNGGSAINVIGEGDSTNKYLGVFLVNSDYDGLFADGAVTLNGGSSITLTNDAGSTDSVMAGILTKGYGSGRAGMSVALNGGSTITLNSYGDGVGIVGVEMKGYGGTLSLNGGSSVLINAQGGGASNKYFGLVTIETAETAAGAGRITLNAGSGVVLTGSGASDSKYLGIFAVGYGGPEKYVGAITLNDSFVTMADTAGTGGNMFLGITSVGGGGLITLNGTSHVDLGSENGFDASSYVGIFSTGGLGDAAPSIVLNDTAAVNIVGSGYSPDAKYLGIGVSGDGATVTLNGNASVNLDLAGAAYPAGMTGIIEYGNGNKVVLNGNAAVRLVSYSGAIGTGVVLAGDESALTMNGNSRIDTTYASYGSGVRMTGDNSSIILNDYAAIYAGGAFSSSGILDEGENNTIVVGQHAYVAGATGIVLDGNLGTLIVRGFVAGYGGTAISTGSGGNSSVTLDSAWVNGAVRGGGSDTLTLAGSGDIMVGTQGFGLLKMDGDYWNLVTGTLNWADQVTIASGRLAVNGTLTSYNGIYVEDGGTLGGSGIVYGEVFVAEGGHLSPGNSPGTLNLVGNITLNSGSIFDVEVEGAAADLLNVDGDVTVDPGAILTPHFIGGVDGFVGDVLTVTGGHSVTGTFLIGSGGAADYTDPSKVTLTAVSSSSMNGGLSAGASTGFVFLDTVLGQAEKGVGRNHNLWASALWHNSDRSADGNTRGFSQKGTGGAFGGNVMEAGDLTLGLAGGYIDNDAVTVGGGTTTKIKGYHVAAYTSYGMGATTLTGAVTAAYQDQDISRNVFSGGVIVGADSSPEAWVAGAGFGIAHTMPLEKGFTLTPKASLGWQHMTRDALTETGGGLGGMSVGEITTDTMRAQAGAELSLMVRDPHAMWSVRPSIRAGVAQEWRGGDETATGTFTTTGAAFAAALDTRDQTYLAVGAGVDMTLGGSITGFVSYDGGFGGDAEKSGGVRLGARFEW